MMKYLIIVLAAAGIMTPCVTHADYYRSTGGGVYELYVDDCSASGMHRALDNATASRHAVITTVKCAADDRQNVRQNVMRTSYYSQWDLDAMPVVELCPCNAVIGCGCGC